jgi:DNA-binding MarR family transcriptional regulator
MNLPKEISDLNSIDELGPAFVGLQLFQLLGIIDFQGNELFARRGITIPSRSGSTILYLHRHKSTTVTGLARYLGMSHQLVSHRIKDLKTTGLITEKQDPADRRRTVIVLSAKGKKVAGQIALISSEIEKVYAELFEEVGIDLFDSLIKVKAALAEKGLSDRVADQHR